MDEVYKLRTWLSIVLQELGTYEDYYNDKSLIEAVGQAREYLATYRPAPPQTAAGGPSEARTDPIYTCRCGKTSPLAMTNGRCGECRERGYQELAREMFPDG